MRVLSLSVLSLCLGWSAVAVAVSPPSEDLFPATTKGWVSVPNVDLLRADFKLTQLGKLIEDPVMQPFMEDLGKQLEEKLNEAGVKLGLQFADLDGVYGGEVATGMLKPDAKAKDSHAVALTVDVTGKHAAAAALLAKIDRNLIAKGAVKGAKKLGATTLIIYTLPMKAGDKGPEKAIYALEGDTLIAADDEAVLIGMLGRLGAKKPADSLGATVPYKQVAAKVHGDKKPLDTHLRWFIEPLGYAEATRAANGGKVKRGLDKIKMLREQGFTCLQGIGGRVDFHDSEHEVLHQTYIFAPADPKAKKGNKYVKAANILDFPNGKNLEVQDWVPNTVSSYLTLNWDLQDAFEHFGSLFDAFADEEGMWEEIIGGWKTDVHGPMIDLNAELIKNLGQRVTAIVDHTHPIHPACERVLVAIELNPADKGAEKKVMAAIKKLMKVESDSRAIQIEGHDAWEVAERMEEAVIPDLIIDSPEFVALEPEGAEDVAAVAPPVVERKINWAVTVANGHLIFGTHVGLIADVLKDKAKDAQLTNAADLARVRKGLIKLGSGDDSFRFFTRTDEACHPTFELLKKGLMPKAETILGRSLNQAFAPVKKGDLRKQEIDGKKLPEWAKIAAYFGPAGTYVQSEADGWLIKGCLMQHELGEGELKKPEEVAGGAKKELE